MAWATTMLSTGADDARGKDNRAEQFKVITTMLDSSTGGSQIGEQPKGRNHSWAVYTYDR
jgi:hypothetical protein